jgi:hypothetical protein
MNGRGEVECVEAYVCTDLTSDKLLSGKLSEQL